jgi:acyl-CoA dehydrogenase
MGEMNLSLLAGPFERVLQGNCTPAQVRAIERGESGAVLWSALVESGFLDALRESDKGGAGLSLREVHPLLELSGGHALPFPFGQTMLARTILDDAGVPVPEESIVLAIGRADSASGKLRCINIAHATTAHWALVQSSGTTVLLPVAEAQLEAIAPNTQSANLSWSTATVQSATALRTPPVDFMALEACVLAPMIAGAMASVMRMTLRHANDRVQFGRTLSKFQAIQHQIAVMAENLALARTAGRLGCDSDGHLPQTQRVAIAKAVTSESAPSVAAMAHAIHGAIGITEEFDLQLFTRRLHEWRLCAGSEVFWNRHSGAQMIASGNMKVVDFIRLRNVC